VKLIKRGIDFSYVGDGLKGDEKSLLKAHYSLMPKCFHALAINNDQ